MTHSLKYSLSVLSLHRIDDVSKLKTPLRHLSHEILILEPLGERKLSGGRKLSEEFSVRKYS